MNTNFQAGVIMNAMLKSVVLAVALGIAASSQAANITINAVDTGWYMEGLRPTNAINYIVGDYGGQIYHDFLSLTPLRFPGRLSARP